RQIAAGANPTGARRRQRGIAGQRTIGQPHAVANATAIRVTPGAASGAVESNRAVYRPSAPGREDAASVGDAAGRSRRSARTGVGGIADNRAARESDRARRVNTSAFAIATGSGVGVRINRRSY